MKGEGISQGLTKVVANNENGEETRNQGFLVGWPSLSEGITQLGDGRHDDVVGLNPNSTERQERGGLDRVCKPERKTTMALRRSMTPTARTSMEGNE